MVSNGKGALMRHFSNRNHVMVEHSQPGALAPRHEYNGYATSGKITRTCGNDGHAWNHRYLDQKTVVHRQSVF
ncbi:type IV secretion protein Rhs [Massilia violaceinigra]|uniref:Type IV secretion protein Rhs n=1 Tax=Massilia violaceinigra TaxID=2045208 RepID=A0ABY4ABE2_9BURK|nr:hypothetical protein [Massilia violaceinigra]UOD30896.1 type IV secretion protein Rhs [Massilia violaceinigra]